MKISPISLNYIKNSKYQNIKQTHTLPQLVKDSVSFCGNLVPNSKVASLKLEANEILSESKEILNDSKIIQKRANKYMQQALDAYNGAISYIEFAKQHLSDGRFEFDDGKVLEFSFAFQAGELYFDISLTNEFDEPILDIVAQDFHPIKITLYKEDGNVVYDFDDDETIISFDVEIDDDMDNDDNIKQSAKKVYTYEFYSLINYKENPSIDDESHTYDKRYYFVDDTLAIYSENVEEKPNGNETQERRFQFVGGELTSFYNNWCGFKNGSMRWDDGYYFDDELFMGKSKNAIQKSSLDNVKAQEIIFRNDKNEFVSNNNFNFMLDDFGVAVFEE